ncbi:MAG: TonB-dependent receptor [Terriglobales bacterium]|jgi:outer membrane receptor protein involved in Fe transport
MLRVRSQGAFLAVVLLIAVAYGAAQSSPVSTITVDGIVQDATGAVIRGATVRLESGMFRATAQTDERGRFVFKSVPFGPGTVQVISQGFVTARTAFNADGSAGESATNRSAVHLDIELATPSVNEQVLVSAARTDVRLADVPGSNVLVSTADLKASPALRMDDVLREVPEFSLYRRSSSRTANASLQGISLRGLGGTASSRALVLADGISLVDPFGAWVYWDRIPTAAISTVEIVRGGASDLYGSDAMGGVVQFLIREPEAPAFTLETSYGNENTPDLSLWAGSRSGPWEYSAATGLFRTDGFILVPDSQRGSIDTKANVEDASVYARLGRSFGADGKVFLRGNFFNEFRNNGTPLQTNDTHIGEGAGGLDKQFGAKDSLSIRLYGDVETYHQVFSAITSVVNPRDTETLTSLQHVPEQVVGGGAQWTHFLGKSQTLVGGMDLSEVIGASVDTLFSGPNQGRVGGGRQRNLGWFGEDIFHRSNWTVILAVRLDDWSNFAGKFITIPLSGAPTVTLFPDRSDLALSPRLSVLRALNQHVSLTGSVYRAFRAPTLNELYRVFRVGNVTTLNNPALNAERLTGAEAGVNVTGWDKRLDVRGTFFWSDIVDPVENVTINQAGTQAMKENLGRTRSRGVELDGVVHVTRDIQITASYAYIGATVVSYPNPVFEDLVGLTVPQVPRNAFTWEARYWRPSRLFLSVQGRFNGRVYNDDQNQYPLNSFYTMNLEVGRDLKRHTEIFASIENLTNQRYQVASTPVPGLPPVFNLGPPILVRAGVRLNFPAAKQ